MKIFVYKELGKQMLSKQQLGYYFQKQRGTAQNPISIEQRYNVKEVFLVFTFFFFKASVCFLALKTKQNKNPEKIDLVKMPLQQQQKNRYAAVSSYGEGNGTPIPYSCLENPMDRGAWQAAVHGVSKSQTQLKRLSSSSSSSIFLYINLFLFDILLHIFLPLLKSIL